MRGLRIKSLDQLGARSGAGFATAPVASVRVRVLGIDPGSRRTGFGVIDCTGTHLVYVASGAIAVSGRQFTDRLRTIFEAHARAHHGISAGGDRDRARVRAQECRQRAEARPGARRGAMCAVLSDDMRIFEYAPRAIKSAVVGYGGARRRPRLRGWCARRSHSTDGSRPTRPTRSRSRSVTRRAAPPPGGSSGGRMIGFLRGRIAVKAAAAARARRRRRRLRARGADVDVLRAARPRAARSCSSPISVIREDAHILYGFATEAERRLFRSLLKVSGVGPRIAIGILSGITVEGFQRCVEDAGHVGAHAHPGRRPQDGRAAADRACAIACMCSSEGRVTAVPDGLTRLRARRARPIAR